MLDQLIESRNHAEENAKRGGFLLATFFLAATVLSSGVLWSLFAKDIAMNANNLELSELIAPIPAAANEAPEPLQKQEKTASRQTSKNTIVTRQNNMARIDEAQPAPNEISVTPNTEKARPAGDFKVSNEAELDIQGSQSVISERSGGENEIGIKYNPPSQSKIVEKPAPPPPPPAIKKKEEEKTLERPKIITSEGVINGKAKFLPKPVYSSAAIAINAKGDVSVQVTIDEEGNVISAKALNGHPLLRDSAEKAARSAKFSPTFLGKQPVKVTGIILYKFSKN
ncbi:MAG TPA: energy transducer TonB [Pyrinomonadaceae bacterium]|jgi:protein TonB